MNKLKVCFQIMKFEKLETSKQCFVYFFFNQFNQFFALFFIFRERIERLTLGKDVDSKDLDAAALQSAQEFEDENVAKLSQFKFANRLTSIITM